MYTKIPLEDPHIGSATQKSAFTFTSGNESLFGNEDLKAKYKSAFTFTRNKDLCEAVENLEPGLFHRICYMIISLLCYFIVLISLPLSALFVVKIVKQNERLVIIRLGRYHSIRNPGAQLVLPCIDKLIRVNIQPKAFSIPPQMILTADGAVVEAGADVFYEVKDILSSISSVQDMNHSVRVLAQTLFIRMMNKLSLSNIQTENHKMVIDLQSTLNVDARKWGSEVTKVLIPAVKVLQEPSGKSNASNPLSTLAPMLFPPGSNIGFQAAPATQIGAGNISQMLPQISSMWANQMQSNSEGEHQKADTDASNVSFSEILHAFEKHMPLHGLTSENLYTFTIPGHGRFFLDMKRQTIGQGEPSGRPDVECTLEMTDLQQLITGNMSPISLYMTNRLQVKGDLKLVQILEPLLHDVQQELTPTCTAQPLVKL